MAYPLLLHPVLEGVHIRLTKSPALDGQEPFLLESFDESIDAPYASANVARQLLLSWKAAVIVPGIRQEHRKGYLLTDCQVAVFQDEIRNLGKAIRNNRIVRIQDNVSLF